MGLIFFAFFEKFFVPILTSGGPASFIMPLQIGKTPIVVPRQHQFNEHVNDHQVEFARNVAQRMGTIIPVEDIETLGDIITNYDQIVAGITFKTCGKLTHINNGNEFFFTDCLATSNIYKPIYSKAFGCSEENIYINSEPVTDVFFNGYKKYDLGNYNKIILWTPTFRQSDYLGYDDSETEELLPLFEEKDYSTRK